MAALGASRLVESAVSSSNISSAGLSMPELKLQCCVINTSNNTSSAVYLVDHPDTSFDDFKDVIAD